jgi:uncharacterized protein
MVVWSALAVVLPAVAQAAGFDCDTASTPVQKLICSDRDLDKLDSDMTTMFADVVTDGKTAQTDTSGIEHDQAAWARGRALCSNANCLKAYYSRRLATLKEAYVRIRDSLAITASVRAKVNRHTWVGTWVSGYSCASAEDRIVIERHMAKIGGGDWTPIDHQEDDTYHGLPVFYIEGRDARANFVYDTHVDIITYNKNGFGSGIGVTYTRCE